VPQEGPAERDDPNIEVSDVEPDGDSYVLPVRPVAVVMLDLPGENGFKLTPGEDQHLVEALTADGTHESLGGGIRPWSPNRCADDADPHGAEDLVEAGDELRVSVAARS